MERCAEIISDLTLIQRTTSEVKATGQKVALVPTMGALHQGHLELVRLAAEKADFVIVSIFVNPTQFNDKSDLQKYPRDLQADLELLANYQVDAVFAPSVEGMYPQKKNGASKTTIAPNGICKELEGEFRPGHFQGVIEVVAKLFHLCQPDFAVFGQKDFQQLAVIKAMVRDLNFPVNIVSCPTVRSEDGLALSSRNQLLSDQQKETALTIVGSLNNVQTALDSGQTDARELSVTLMQELIDGGLDSVDYAVIVHPETLAVLDEIETEAVALVAGHVGKVRLIDNIILKR